jgi:hypothetical protein
MSDFSAISAVSQTLRELLNQKITLSSGILNGIPIHLESPKECQLGGLTGISVWLYKVSRMGEMLNQPPERRGLDLIAKAPLPVDLHYLVTPLMTDPTTRHTVMGRILQLFHDHANLSGAELQGTLQGSSEQLRVNLEALTLEELSQVWDALSEPYQLSVTYLVQAVKIDSDLEPVKTGIVLERDARYSQIVSEV